MNKLIDSHCHLQYWKDDFALQEVIKEAIDSNVSHMLCVATAISEYGRLKEIKAMSPEHISLSLGAHPLDGDLASVDWHLFEELLKDQDIIAIGETGFDFKEDLKSQRFGFEKHMELAHKYDLPIILHTREAEAETKEALKEANVRGVFHCFTGSIDLAEFAVMHGWSISFSGIITFKNANALREVALHLKKNGALSSILVETDAPYLAPQEFRGKQNKPAYVRSTANFIADLFEISHEEFAMLTVRNFHNLFRKR